MHRVIFQTPWLSFTALSSRRVKSSENGAFQKADAVILHPITYHPEEERNEWDRTGRRAAQAHANPYKSIH